MSESTPNPNSGTSGGETVQEHNQPVQPVNQPSESPDKAPEPTKRRRRRKRFIRFMSGGDASPKDEEVTQPEQASTPPIIEQEVEDESDEQSPIEKNPEEVTVEITGKMDVPIEEVSEPKDVTEEAAEQEESTEADTEAEVEKQEPHVNLRMRGPPIMDHTWSRATELSGPPRDPLGLGWIIESPQAVHGIEKARGAPINPLRPHERRGPPDPLVEWLCEDDTLTLAVDAVQDLLQGLNGPTSEEE